MHLDGLGDIGQHHRLHILFTLFEKSLLLLYDAAADAQQGIVAAFQTFNQPAGFLQIAANELAVGVIAGAVAHCRILLIYFQPWNAVGVELDGPAAAHLAHQHIRDDIFRFAGLNGLARARIQGLDQVDRLFKHLFFQAGDSH